MKIKRLMKLLLMLVFLCTADRVSSQAINMAFGDFVQYEMGAQRGDKNALSLEYKGISGSPYYNNKFLSSNLYFENGKVRTNVYVRLNLYNNSLQFEQGRDFYVLDQIENIDKIVISNTEFMFLGKEYFEHRGFYELVEDGKTKLLKGLKVTFTDGEESANSYGNDIEAEFKREKEKLYILLDSGDLLYFKNKKQFYLQFSENTNLVAYAKGEKLNPAKIDDFKKIVSYMNSLN